MILQIFNTQQPKQTKNNNVCMNLTSMALNMSESLVHEFETGICGLLSHSLFFALCSVLITLVL